MQKSKSEHRTDESCNAKVSCPNLVTLNWGKMLWKNPVLLKCLTQKSCGSKIEVCELKESKSMDSIEEFCNAMLSSKDDISY